MTNAGLQELVEFQNWAREQALPALEALHAEEWQRPLGGSFAHLHATVVHIIWAQELWADRLAGNPRREFAAPQGAPDFDALRARWRKAGLALQTWLAAQPEAAAPHLIRYIRQGQTVETPVEAVMLQLSHHHAYHLGQVAHMLRQLGHVPPDTGYIGYQRQRTQRRI